MLIFYHYINKLILNIQIFHNGDDNLKIIHLRKYIYRLH
uniref:Uncharacterized protein n=1 Tax=Taenioma perpusillum TaxID=210852 RepID=A0A1Z1MQX8_9FLOR|nr:hypothetical protein [Taenioma perpusillum]ARW68487.1 hypothetical protein [Taenioma perpusillum]